MLYNQGNYSKALETYQAVFDLGPDHPDTLLTSCKIEKVRKEMNTESQRERQRQQKAYFHLSECVSNNFQNASIESAEQGLYLPSFETRNVKINGKCTAITRGLSQNLFKILDM